MCKKIFRIIIWHVTVEYKFTGLLIDENFSEKIEMWVELIRRPWNGGLQIYFDKYNDS